MLCNLSRGRSRCRLRSRLRSRLFTQLGFMALCVSFSACASLPDVRYLKTSLDPQSSATVQTTQGTLSRKKTESLLVQRLRSAKIDLPELAALEEAATGSPL